MFFFNPEYFAYKKLSYRWQTARRVYTSVKFTKHGTIRFLLVCYSNTVPEIFDFKNSMTLKTVLGVRQGHWKCRHVIEHIWLPIDVL